MELSSSVVIIEVCGKELGRQVSCEHCQSSNARKSSSHDTYDGIDVECSTDCTT